MNRKSFAISLLSKSSMFGYCTRGSIRLEWKTGVELNRFIVGRFSIELLVRPPDDRPFVRAFDGRLVVRLLGDKLLDGRPFVRAPDVVRLLVVRLPAAVRLLAARRLLDRALFRLFERSGRCAPNDGLLIGCGLLKLTSCDLLWSASGEPAPVNEGCRVPFGCLNVDEFSEFRVVLFAEENAELEGLFGR